MSAYKLTVVIGAFAASFMVGLVIPFAPAGVGARELTLVALLATVLPVSDAIAAALVVRIGHTIADFGLAGTTWVYEFRKRSTL